MISATSEDSAKFYQNYSNFDLRSPRCFISLLLCPMKLPLEIVRGFKFKKPNLLDSSSLQINQLEFLSNYQVFNLGRNYFLYKDISVAITAKKNHEIWQVLDISMLNIRLNILTTVSLSIPSISAPSRPSLTIST